MRWLWLLAIATACGDNIVPGTPGDSAGHPADAKLDGDGVPIVDDGAGGDGPGVVSPDARPNLQCATPEAPAAVDHTLVVNVPSDFDATANPTATTTIAFTVLLPARCPGDAFPLVLHSHGYGGKRIAALAADGALHPELAHFGSIDALVAALPYHGYAVISFDERGHGASTNANARIIDPAAETRDARALLDWAFDHPDDSFAVHEDATTGIAKDLRVGTIGYSYGGGFQFPLAALDARVDTIVPNGTWHDLVYSLMPGNAVKLSFDGLLCLLATTGGVKNTPLVQTLCNAVGYANPAAGAARSRSDLATAVNGPTATPRKVTETELVTFLDHHGMDYFEAQQMAHHAWGFGESAATLRAVPALLLQGNRDVLFNATEAMWNARYFAATGADVRMVTTEGGHMNPLANQVEGTASCGGVKGVVAILAWLDYQLKGEGDVAGIPKTCVSIADTANAATAPAAGLVSDHVLIGSQTGAGAIAAKLASASANLPLGTQQVFVPVVTVHGSGRVLAGVPTIGSLTVTAGTGALASTNAFVGVGIQRGGTTFLVDDQVTGFAAGTHTTNKNVGEDAKVLLPAVGEMLHDGDVVGLLVMSQSVQYAAVISAASAPGAPGVVTYVGGVPVPPITSGLSPILGVAYLNPYSISFTNIELPIVEPGTFAGTSLSL